MLQEESQNTHWSLFNRFVMAAQMLDAADAAGALRGAPWPASGGVGRVPTQPRLPASRGAEQQAARATRAGAQLSCPAPPAPAGPRGMGFFFTWLRLSTMRQLDWWVVRPPGRLAGWRNG